MLCMILPKTYVKILPVQQNQQITRIEVYEYSPYEKQDPLDTEKDNLQQYTTAAVVVAAHDEGDLRFRAGMV